MTTLPDKKPEFTITIDGTTFTTYLDEEACKLQIKVEGVAAAERGKATLNLICDKLRRDLSYNPAIKHITSNSRELESELALTFIGDSDPIPAQNVAFEVHGYLTELKKHAETVGPFTKERIGFDIALLDMGRPLNSITLNHVPGKPKQPYPFKQNVPLEDLRAAIIRGVNESGVYAHLDGGLADIRPISGAIIDAIYEAQAAKKNPESKWDTTIPLTDREIVRAIEAGIKKGLQLVKAPNDQDKDMEVDLRREILASIRSMQNQR